MTYIKTPYYQPIRIKKGIYAYILYKHKANMKSKYKIDIY